MDEGRLPHALLFAGPARMGKRKVAEHLARRLLCLTRTAGQPACGQCRSCQLFATRIQPTMPAPATEKSREIAQTRPDGSLVHPFGLPGHPDARFISYELNEKTHKMRTEILIEQIRAMSEALTLTPQYGTHQVALIDPADAINHAACNALLKTLEEPQPERFIWLISTHPNRLPATIRSRTQRLDFRLPPHREALEWLCQNAGYPEAQAEQALTLAGGHPGLAQQWLASDVLSLRKSIADDLQHLAKHRQDASMIARRWVDDENAAQRLAFAADIALHMARTAPPGQVHKLADWFDKANQVREQLRTPVRHDLAVLELLLDWPAVH